MPYITKKMASWEIEYGQIAISGKENVIARDLFKSFFGKTFKLQTFLGTFKDVNFNEKTSSTSLRLSCSVFFKKLSPGDIIFLQPIDDDTVEILNAEPQSKPVKQTIEKKSKFSEDELLELITTLTKENQELRETNSNLFIYKERIEKYEGLQKIFSDERFMEDWLERNIHKAIQNNLNLN